MVLDTAKDEMFVFKNTYAKNKQVTIPVDKGPLEFYFVHLELTKEALNELKKRIKTKRPSKGVVTQNAKKRRVKSKSK